MAGEQTIASAIEQLDDLKAVTRQKQMAGELMDMGKESLKVANPIYGVLMLAKKKYSRINDIRNEKAKTADIDKVEDFPLLDLFDIHPTFFEVLDDALLDTIEDLYEKDVLRRAKPSDKVRSIIDINVYIQNYLRDMYDITFKLTPKNLGPVQ